MITGIVVALPEEIGTLTARKIGKGCCAFISPDVVIAHAGAGPDNARTAAEQLIAQGAQRLISWGCAAALVDTLMPGDLTLVDSLISEQQEIIDIASDWLTGTRTVLAELQPTITGCLAESRTLIASTTAKADLHRRTQAIVLDMETVAIAKVARQRDLPCLAIRAIADPVMMDLPGAVSHSLNNAGEVVLSRLLLYLVWHPRELTGLIQLGLHFSAAKKTLKRAAQQLDTLTHSSRT